MAYPGSRSHTWVAGERVDHDDLNEWAPKNVGWGNAATPVSAAGAQSGITTVVDVTGCTITYSPLTGRRYLVIADIVVATVTNSASIEAIITDGSNNPLVADYLATPSALGATSIHIVLDEAPSTGSVTRKVRVQRTAGTGTINTGGTSRIRVLDTGPSTP